MSKMFPLRKFKHTGSVLRELQRDCFPFSMKLCNIL
ncbi:hypothetical protein T10_7890 [Trichinella papuae]|uniref:Uncharacterized protein n=1 Tax=Trichinella papuae TaxID=268474 RepID=A0A0V1LXS7_9BILA|nr:hypothetical protein T10_7890 [Trichinella papuae]